MELCSGVVDLHNLYSTALTSVNRFVIFPFFISQRKTPFLAVAPQMQFTSPFWNKMNVKNVFYIVLGRISGEEGSYNQMMDSTDRFVRISNSTKKAAKLLAVCDTFWHGF